MRYLAVFGDPIAHSVSPRLHNLAAEALKIDAIYGRYQLKERGVAALKSHFLALGLCGANVTIPHKESAAQMADIIDPAASAIGAANTLVRRGDKICAYNTDAPGFMLAIASFKEVRNALIIGAGGTARALSFALKNAGINADILNRSDRAADFEGYRFFTPATIFGADTQYDLIINTTPAGLVNADLPADEAVMRRVFSGAKYAFDAVYGRMTPFLRMAGELKLDYKDGKEMLLNQAAIAFCHFFNDEGFEPSYIADIMRPALDL